MTTLLQLVAYMTVLTWVSIMAGAFLRNREWTLEGMQFGLSNRDHRPSPLRSGDAPSAPLRTLLRISFCSWPSRSRRKRDALWRPAK